MATKPSKARKESILVFSGNSTASYREFFEFRGFKTIRLEDLTQLNSDHVVGAVFCGGADVDPRMYGQLPLQNAGVSASVSQDKADFQLYEMAKNLSVPMIGICRGLQFINVVHGGTLIQHLNEHGGGLHEVRAYDGTKHKVNSYHHQSVILPKNARATTVAYIQHPLSEEEDTIYQHDSEEEHVEVEAVFYGKTRSLGVQWHPEIPDHGGNSKSLFWNLFTLTDITIPD